MATHSSRCVSLRSFFTCVICRLWACVPDIWDLAQCNECKAEIQVTRFHCFQCGEGENEGYDLCRYKSFL